MEHENETIVYKLVTIGESKVGKTSLIQRYLKGKYDTMEENQRTVNAYNTFKLIQLNSSNIKLNIWDTAGEEKYHALTKLYYQDADGILLVFDGSDIDSFKLISKWIDEVKSFSKSNVKFVVCGNKCDLKLQVSEEEALMFAKGLSAQFFWSSAKEDLNVKILFETLAKEIHDSKPANSGQNPKKRKSLKIIEEFNKERKNSKKCC